VFDWVEDHACYPLTVESWSEAEARAALVRAGVTVEQADRVTGFGSRSGGWCAPDDLLWRKVACGALSIEGAVRVIGAGPEWTPYGRRRFA